MTDAIITLAIIIACLLLAQQGIRWNARRVARKRRENGIQGAFRPGLASLLMRIKESAR